MVYLRNRKMKNFKKECNASDPRWQYFHVIHHVTIIPQHQLFSLRKKTGCQSLVLMREEGGSWLCRQLLLWFPRETVVEAAEEKEWEGRGLAHMGQSSVRCLLVGGYLNFLSEAGLWRALMFQCGDKQQVLILSPNFLGENAFLGFVFPIGHQKYEYFTILWPECSFIFPLCSSQTQVREREE